MPTVADDRCFPSEQQNGNKTGRLPNVTKLRRKWLAGKGLLVAGTGTIEPVVFLGPTLDRAGSTRPGRSGFTRSLPNGVVGVA